MAGIIELCMEWQSKYLRWPTRTLFEMGLKQFKTVHFGKDEEPQREHRCFAAIPGRLDLVEWNDNEDCKSFVSHAPRWKEQCWSLFGKTNRKRRKEKEEKKTDRDRGRERERERDEENFQREDKKIKNLATTAKILADPIDLPILLCWHSLFCTEEVTDDDKDSRWYFMGKLGKHMCSISLPQWVSEWGSGGATLAIWRYKKVCVVQFLYDPELPLPECRKMIASIWTVVEFHSVDSTVQSHYYYYKSRRHHALIFKKCTQSHRVL